MKISKMKKLRFKNKIKKLWSYLIKKGVWGECPFCEEWIKIYWDSLNGAWWDCCCVCIGKVKEYKNFKNYIKEMDRTPQEKMAKLTEEVIGKERLRQLTGRKK